MPPPPPPPRWRRKRRGRRFVVVGFLPVLVPVLGSSFATILGRHHPTIVPPVLVRHHATFAAATADATTVAFVVPPAPGRRRGRARRSLLPVLGGHGDDAGIIGDDDDDPQPPVLDELLGLMDDGLGDTDAADRGRGGEASFRHGHGDGHGDGHGHGHGDGDGVVAAEKSTSRPRRIIIRDEERTRRRPPSPADEDGDDPRSAATVPVPPGERQSDQLRHRHHHHPLLASLDSSPSEEEEEEDDDDKRKQFHPGRNGYNATLLLECEFDVRKYVVRRDEVEWDTMVGLLRDFRSRHGHCRVPTSYDGYRRMRTEEEGELDSTKTVSSAEAEADASASSRGREGDGAEDDDEEDVLGEEDVRRLIRWVRLQRRLYKKLQTMLEEEDDAEGERESERENESSGGERVVVGATEGWTMLTPDRVDTLTGIGFDFNPGRGPRHLADRRLDELRLFKEEHGHVDVPPRYPPNPRLAAWVAEQRLQYRRLMEEQEEEKEMRRGRSGSRSGATDEASRRRIYSSRTGPEFLEELRRLGFDFEPPKRGGRRRRKGRGASITSSGSGSNEVSSSTGEVVVDDEEKEEEGEEGEEDWDEMVEELLRFRSAHGHCRVPHTHGRLGRWTYLQRRRYRRHLLDAGETEDEGEGELGGMAPSSSSLLTQGRIDELRSMGFDWDATEVEVARRAQDVAWVERLDELVAYRERNGHVQVPVDYGEHHDLGLWVVRQGRYGELSREGKVSPLTKERIEILEGLGVFDDDDDDDNNDVGPPQPLVKVSDPRREDVRITPLVPRLDGGVT